MTDFTRRQFIRSGGAAVAAASIATIASTPAAASHMDEAGDNISLDYDQTALDTYRPRFVFPTEAKKKLIGVYGWIASSPDYDTDVACYWCWYTNQEGWIGPDSHFGDTEPVQVEYDSETGDVERVRASVYHWMKGETTPSDALMYEETHPHLRVVSPHHQYTIARQSDDGSYTEIKDLTEAYPKWLSNRLEDDISLGASTVPWRMRDRGHWWADTEAGFSVNAAFVGALERANVGTRGSLSR